MADLTNPYAPDRAQQIAMLLMSLGGGISQAGAANRPAWEGIAPGAAMFSNGLMQSQQMGQQRALQEEAAQLRRRQMGLQEQEIADKRAEREARIKGMGAWAAANEPGTATVSVPGMGPPPVQPRIGPQDYGTRTAGLEGGSRNGGFVFNELGSGAFGPYQFMPATWADVRTKNPELNLPADMTQANRDQHKAAFDSFTKGNATILQQAGIQPTPENLYLAHRFGAGGATTMLRADPNARLADVLPADWQRQNPDMRGQTVASFQRLASERMKGVGMPYQAAGEQTSYALPPNGLPAYAGPGMPAIQPGAVPMPTFGGRAIATNYQPGPQVAQAPQNIAQGDSIPSPPPPLPSPPQVPQPSLSPEEFASIRASATTPKEAEEMKRKLISEKWKRAQDVADKVWQQERDDYRFNRSEATKADQWYTLSADDVKMYPGLDASKAHQRNKRTGEIKPIGGSLVNIDQKGQTEFAKEMGKIDAKRFGEIMTAESTMSDMASKLSFALDQFSQTYTGPGAETANAFFKTLGTFGSEDLAKKASAADAAQAVISQMKPHMRASGSGASSDRDMDMFAKALPSLLNTPDGNQRINAYFQRLADRATQVRQLAQEHSQGGKVPLTDTGFDDAVKKLGPLFSKEELAEMQAAGKAKAGTPAPDTKAIREKYGLISAPVDSTQLPAQPDLRGKYGLK